MVEDEDESTRASGRGQLHMFGAVEEKVGADFAGWVAIREFSAWLTSAMWRAVFLVDLNREEKSGDLDQDNFHRLCTGNAERQLSVLGSRLSVGFLPTTPTRPRILVDLVGRVLEPGPEYSYRPARAGS